MGNFPHAHCSLLSAVIFLNQFTMHHPQVQFQPRAAACSYCCGVTS